MQEKKNILTYEGLRKYEDELHDLKVVKRQEVAQKIKEAREQGDLSENAEYDAAKDEQRDIEARIEELEKILKNAEVVGFTITSYIYILVTHTLATIQITLDVHTITAGERFRIKEITCGACKMFGLAIMRIIGHMFTEIIATAGSIIGNGTDTIYTNLKLWFGFFTIRYALNFIYRQTVALDIIPGKGVVARV